jgi:glucose-1-phosphate cytidylyltransferase
MQVVILCGGKGTRLGDVTGDLIPKPMVRIGDRPIIAHIMQHYAKAGHRQFILCAGHLSWTIKDYFMNFRTRQADIRLSTADNSQLHVLSGGPNEDWDITIAETGQETGTSGRLKRVAKYLEGDAFMLTYGDGVSDVDIGSLAKFHTSHGKAVTMTGIVPPGRFGELILDGDRITEMQEKPQVSDRYINGGFMVMQREFLDRFVTPHPDSTMLEREPLAEAARQDELRLFRHHGFWQCMDTARDWTYLDELHASGNAPWLA